ncbi:MAG: hypothetical protein AAF902_14105 [Chloroflexota bacterium]
MEQQQASSTESMTYQIRLSGHLPPNWGDWFDQANVLQNENGETALVCEVSDQAALFGLLKRVRDLGLPLISVEQVKDDQA